MKLKVDLYTRIVLTLIAVGLFANVAKDMDFIIQARAAEVPANTRVMLPNTEGVIDVNIVQVDGKSVGENHIPVMVKNSSMESVPIYSGAYPSGNLPVEIKGISTSDEMYVKQRYSIDAFTVKVTNFP